jgi:hypothetical protein
MFQLEEPVFEIVKKESDFELRSYRPMIVAEVFVQGDISTAGKEGARLVKDYIFREGANEPVDVSWSDPEKISMTLPVTMEKTPEKIFMTVPVTMEPNAESGYRLHFVMPSKYTLQTLPKPADPRVTLREIPSQKVAAVPFLKVQLRSHGCVANRAAPELDDAARFDSHGKASVRPLRSAVRSAPAATQ